MNNSFFIYFINYFIYLYLRSHNKNSADAEDDNGKGTHMSKRLVADETKEIRNFKFKTTSWPLYNQNFVFVLSFSCNTVSQRSAHSFESELNLNLKLTYVNVADATEDRKVRK